MAYGLTHLLMGSMVLMLPSQCIVAVSLGHLVPMHLCIRVLLVWRNWCRMEVMRTVLLMILEALVLEFISLINTSSLVTLLALLAGGESKG